MAAEVAVLADVLRVRTDPSHGTKSSHGEFALIPEYLPSFGASTSDGQRYCLTTDRAGDPGRAADRMHTHVTAMGPHYRKVGAV